MIKGKCKLEIKDHVDFYYDVKIIMKQATKGLDIESAVKQILKKVREYSD